MYYDATYLYKRTIKTSENRNSCMSLARYQAQPTHCNNRSTNHSSPLEFYRLAIGQTLEHTKSFPQRSHDSFCRNMIHFLRYVIPCWLFPQIVPNWKILKSTKYNRKMHIHVTTGNQKRSSHAPDKLPQTATVYCLVYHYSRESDNDNA